MSNLWFYIVVLESILMIASDGALASAQDGLRVYGTAYIDENTNGVFDFGEPTPSGVEVLVYLRGRGYRNTYTDTSGYFELSLEPGAYAMFGGFREPGFVEPYLSSHRGCTGLFIEPKDRAKLVNLRLQRQYKTGNTWQWPREPLDWEIPGGHYYKQTARITEESVCDDGFRVINDVAASFYSAFQRYGGLDTLGYPISQRFEYKGLQTQAFQKLVLQWHPGVGAAAPVNVFDELHRAGKDAWLEAVRAVPPPFDDAPDTGLPWEAVVARHIGFLDGYPALKQHYLDNPDAIVMWGLPVSVKDYGDVIAVRCQRAVLQQWKVATPWAAAGQIVVANGGDVAKEAGLFPEAALRPVPPP